MKWKKTMGAWGYAILENDTAQDGMCDVAHGIQGDIESLPDVGNEDTAAMLGAAIGLLLQFSLYSFNPDNEFYNVLLKKLKAHQDHFTKLPGNSSNILRSIIDGRGTELASREGPLDKQIEIALHSDENEDFIMQKAFSVSETDLFSHPVAKTYLQTIADKLVEQVNQGFQDDELVSDLSREGYFMGNFALLLIIPKADVDPEHFVKWQTKFHKVIDNMESETDEIEKVFDEKYNRYLDIAFRCGIEQYSKT